MRYRPTLAAAGMVAMAATTMPARAQESPRPNDTPNYAHYEQPIECVEAAERVGRDYWRLRRADTVNFHRIRDTLPTVMVRTARDCGTRFRTATVSVGALLDLARLALIAGRDDVVTAAIDRRLANVPPSGDRATVLYDVVSWLLSAKPYHPELVAKYQSQLEALGAAAAIPRMVVLNRMSGMALVDTDFATVQRTMRESMRLYRAAPVTSLDTVLFWSRIGQQFIDFGIVEWLLHGKAALQAVSDTSVAMLGTSVGQLVRIFLASHLGQPVPPPPIFVGSGTDSSDALPPPGHAMLIASRCFGPGVDGAPSVMRCYEEYAAQRRLLAALAARGIAVITIYPTQGFFRNSDPLPAEQEADSARRYVHEHFPFPKPFLVTATQFTQLDDGRFVVTNGGALGFDAFTAADGTLQLYGPLGGAEGYDAIFAWDLQHVFTPTMAGATEGGPQR